MNAQTQKTLATIAQKVLGIETLDTQKSDRLDFHEIAVWNVKEALEAAYRAGQESAARSAK
jgi:hypothetical protein